jgi:two-component system sensor histidine kinase KdpD
MTRADAHPAVGPPVVAACAWAVGVVLLATAVGWLASYGARIPAPDSPPRLANSNVLMLYLLGVLWVATRHTRPAAILASLLGVAAFDFCFVTPYFRFNVADEQYLVTFAVMLVTALTISTLTHRVRVQSAAAREAWERVEREFLRNTLLSGVSHELRTPLAAITGAASTLIEAREQLAPASREEMLQTIYDEAERMERLISNLLEMTRLESGELIVTPDWVPLQELVGSALHRLDRALSGREVRIDVSAELPMVFVDGVGIEQVLVNLVDNAVQYTPAGSPIEIVAGRDGDGRVRVEVRDHGPGLPKGAETRVFEKFFRSHGSDPPPGRGRGIGLGLAICRAIVEAHGGTISAANRAAGADGQPAGAVFRFTLPQRMTPPVVDATG